MNFLVKLLALKIYRWNEVTSIISVSSVSGKPAGFGSKNIKSAALYFPQCRMGEMMCREFCDEEEQLHKPIAASLLTLLVDLNGHFFLLTSTQTLRSL
jgi:hypothetical protein